MNPDSTISLAEVNNEVFDQRAIAQLKRQLSRANADEAQKAHAIQLLATSLRAVQAQAKTAQAENQQLKALAMRLSQKQQAENQKLEVAVQAQQQKLLTSNTQLESQKRILGAEKA